jgi:hypothetical protein
MDTISASAAHGMLHLYNLKNFLFNLIKTAKKKPMTNKDWASEGACNFSGKKFPPG